MVLAGVVVGILSPGGFGVDAFALGAGAGLSVLLFGWLMRLGISGEREREEAAREYFQRHGRWPEDE